MSEVIEKDKEIAIKKRKIQICGISIWRIFAYFIIYSIIGYIIETSFALIVYGVIESRQSFLYGPFCSIYGVGATIMILSLQYFKKNGHSIFIGGFIVGSIVEYVVSFLGEVILGIKWWDYSDRFLNINGRICFSYSIFWGLLGVYLMKVINPKIDKIIDWIKLKIKIKVLKPVTLVIIVLMFIDCVASGIATDWFLTRMIVENDLKVSDKEERIIEYEKVYNNENLSKFISKFWNNNKMIKTYPNLTLTLEDGTYLYIKTLLPDIEPYFYKFER